MSNAMEFDVPDDFGDDGQFLRTPGIYHLAVQDVTVGAGPSGKAIDGFTVALEVLDGTVRSESGCTEIGNTINVTYFNPKLTEKDGGLFTRKKQSKFLVAVNALDPTLKGKKVSIDLEKVRGQQLIASLEVDDYNSQEGKKYLQVSGAGLDAWHVDDPRAAGIPKSPAALKLIPATLRHDAKWFEAIYAKRTPNGGSGTKTTDPAGAGAATATAAPATSRVNLDDI